MIFHPLFYISSAHGKDATPQQAPDTIKPSLTDAASIRKKLPASTSVGYRPGLPRDTCRSPAANPADKQEGAHRDGGRPPGNR